MSRLFDPGVHVLNYFCWMVHHLSCNSGRTMFYTMASVQTLYWVLNRKMDKEGKALRLIGQV